MRKAASNAKIKVSYNDGYYTISGEIFCDKSDNLQNIKDKILEDIWLNVDLEIKYSNVEEQNE